MLSLITIIKEFYAGFRHVSRRQCIKSEKQLRDDLSERQLDAMIADSMIASDPPSTY